MSQDMNKETKHPHAVPCSFCLERSFLFCFLNLFLTGQLLYNVLLVSAIHQHESAMHACLVTSVVSNSLRPYGL